METNTFAGMSAANEIRFDGLVAALRSVYRALHRNVICVPPNPASS